MDALFSTIAQISFTLVGLLFLSFTVDAKSRLFWFGKYPKNRYAYITVLYLILPGGLALGGLIPSYWKTVPSWLPFSFLMLVIYVFLFFELIKLKKEKKYKDIAAFENKLDLSKSALSNLGFILVSIIFGLLAVLTSSSQIMLFSNFLFGLVLCIMTIINIVPISVFLRVQTEVFNKSQKLNKKLNKSR